MAHTRRHGGPPAAAPVAAPELGELGIGIMLRLLQQRAGEPLPALASLLAHTYGALVGGDVAGACSALGAVVGPAHHLEQALQMLQRAVEEAQEATAALVPVTPLAINADLAFSGPQLDAWRAALEASVAAQMDVIERLTIVQQRAQAAAPEPVGV